MRAAGALALVALAVACGCFGGAEPHRLLERAPGTLPAGWKLDAKSNDLVDQDSGYRFPVAVSGALRGEPTQHSEVGAITLEYRGLRNGLDSLLVFYAPFVSKGATPPGAIEAMLREARRDLPGVRVERVEALALPLGSQNTARGCQAVLRQTVGAGEAVWLYFAVPDRDGMIGLRTVYLDEPSGEAQQDAWQLSAALLDLLEPPAERRAAMAHSTYQPPHFSGSCADPAAPLP